MQLSRKFLRGNKCANVQPGELYSYSPGSALANFWAQNLLLGDEFCMLLLLCNILENTDCFSNFGIGDNYLKYLTKIFQEHTLSVK